MGVVGQGWMTSEARVYSYGYLRGRLPDKYFCPIKSASGISSVFCKLLLSEYNCWSRVSEPRYLA